MIPLNFIHPTALLAHDVKVWHFAVIQEFAILDPGVSIGSGTEVGRHSHIGVDSRISAHVFLPAHSRIGARVFIGPGVTFTDDRYPRVNNSGYPAEPPVVHNGASIGAGSVILPGVVIGEGAMIGAGSVVTRSVPAGTTIYGPAASARAVPPRDHTSAFLSSFPNDSLPAESIG